jgi:SAM-dependent methyltransferase
MNPTHSIRDFHQCFREVTAGYASVLEVGCGNGSHLRQVANATRRVGIEIIPEYPIAGGGVEFIIGDALEKLKTFKDASFDLILLMDIVEHFGKDDGIWVLRQCQRIASRRIVLWVPEGRCPQSREYYDSGTYPYRPSQDHLSDWDRKELHDLGFDVGVWEQYHFDRSSGTRDKTIAALFCVWDNPEWGKK